MPLSSSTGLQFTLGDVYLIFCAFMANAPDIDTVVVRILRLEHFQHHRTWSHSFLGSLFFVPLLAIAMKATLGSSIGFLHALLIACSCFYSHLVTDWITAYGIGLFWWPGQETTFFSLGVITIFDFVTLIIWYSTFIASWYGILRPGLLFSVFSTVLSLWLFYKRLHLYAAHRYTYTLSKAPEKKAWLQPASFQPHVFGYFRVREEVELRAEIATKQLEQLSQLAWTGGNLKKHVIASFLDADLGYSRVAPREALVMSDKKGSVYRKWMYKHTRWCILLVLAHFVWFIFAVRTHQIGLPAL